MSYTGIEEGVGELIIPIFSSRAYSYAWAGIERSRLHQHPFTEVYYILATGYTDSEKPGYVHGENEVLEVEKGDVVVIGPDVKHYAENVSLFVFCTPRFDESLVKYQA